MARFGGLFAPLFLCTGCVVGAPRPTPRVETARAPVARAEREPIALPVPAGCAAGEERARPPRPANDAVWVDGYCHYNGTRYTWVDGSWRRR